MLKPLEAQWFGLKTYQEGLEIQNLKHKIVKENNAPFLIGLEHESVLSLGLRSHKDQDLLNLDSEFDIFLSRRGGHATIHNPGQLVIYPIFPLRESGIGVSDFVCLLIKTTKGLLRKYGIESFEKEEPGLFTKNGKIALLGIQVSQGVTLHGIAININNDLSPFQKIPVCGVQSEPMDRMNFYQQNLILSQLFTEWSQLFKEQLQDPQSCS